MKDLSVRSNQVPEINTKLGLVKDFLDKGVRAYFITVTSPSTASLPFAITHTLGVTPDFVLSASNSGTSTLGWTTADKKLWGTKSVVVRAPFALTQYDAVVVKVG